MSFSYRLRGLDEDEVRDFLYLLADQVQAADAERTGLRAEVQRLVGELERLRAERSADSSAPEVNPHSVALFSQAQQVADQLIEEAVRRARELMITARAQQRDILQQAHDAAEQAGRTAGAHAAGATEAAEADTSGYTTRVDEIEYVRTFAKVAQVQLRSVLEALTEQVDKLGDVPKMSPNDR